jgi:hypothetical protein
MLRPQENKERKRERERKPRNMTNVAQKHVRKCFLVNLILNKKNEKHGASPASHLHWKLQSSNT